MKRLRWIARIINNQLKIAISSIKLNIKTEDSPIFTMTNIVCFDKPQLSMPDFKMCDYLMKQGVDLTTCDSIKCDSTGVAQIALSKTNGKWYGWSHRAVYGFGIGYIAKVGDACTSSGYIDEYIKENPELDKSVPVGFEVKSLEEAKMVAIAFAESVS